MPRQWSPARAAGLLVICGLLGCGETTGLGPEGLTGTWSYRVSTFVGRDYTCVSQDTMFASLVLHQETPGSFGGTYAATDLECMGSGGRVKTGSGSGEVFDGRLVGVNVTFRFNLDPLTSTGTVSNGRMSGTATFLISRDGVPDTLIASWHADRVPAVDGRAVVGGS